MGYILVKTVEIDHSIFCLEQLPSGELVSISGEDNTIRVWNLQSGGYLRILQGFEWISCIQSLPNYKLACGSYGGTVRIYDLASGECLKVLRDPFQSSISCLQLLPNGSLISGSLDGGVLIWDLQHGNQPEIFGQMDRFLFHSVCCLHLLPNGLLVSGGSWDGTIRIWDLSNGNCLNTLNAHTSRVNFLRSLPNDKLVSGSSDGTIRIWDLQSGNSYKILQEFSGIGGIQLISDTRLISGSYNGIIQMLDLSSGNCLKSLQGRGSISYLQLLPNGQLISGNCSDKTIQIWDLTEFLKTDIVDEVLVSAMAGINFVTNDFKPKPY